MVATQVKLRSHPRQSHIIHASPHHLLLPLHSHHLTDPQQEANPGVVSPLGQGQLPPRPVKITPNPRGVPLLYRWHHLWRNLLPASALKITEGEGPHNDD